MRRVINRQRSIANPSCHNACCGHVWRSACLILIEEHEPNLKACEASTTLNSISSKATVVMVFVMTHAG